MSRASASWPTWTSWRPRWRGRPSPGPGAHHRQHVDRTNPAGPAGPRLLAAHPGLRLDLSFTDQVVDLLEAGVDIAIRWGRLPVSDVVARLLGRTRQVVVGSPDYLAVHGTPVHPDDLGGHLRLGWNYRREVPRWPFEVAGRQVEVEIGDIVRVNDGEVMRKLALSGVGLARLSVYHAWEDLLAGRLVPVLESCNAGDLEPIHAVYVGKPGRLPPRTRAVLDFLQANVDLGYAERTPPPGSRPVPDEPPGCGGYPDKRLAN